LHFFEFNEFDPLTYYGQLNLRSNDIDKLYQTLIENNTPNHPNDKLEIGFGTKRIYVSRPRLHSAYLWSRDLIRFD
jgi:hypothetical protein